MVLPAPESLPGFADWEGLATLVMVLRITEVDGQEKGEVSYYLSSLPPKVKTLAKLIRQHWSIESQLALGARCNFYRRRQPHSQAARPADLGHVATPGSVHPVGGHFRQR